MKQIEHSVIHLVQKPDGLWLRTWLSDWPSLAEAQAEKKRLAKEEPGFEVKVVPSFDWHQGEVKW